MTPNVGAHERSTGLTPRLHTMRGVSEAWEEMFAGDSDAWETLFETIPDRWTVQKPFYDPARRSWQMYAFDQRDQATTETRAWTAEAPTEDLVVFEMARCPREISEGRVPK